MLNHAVKYMSFVTPGTTWCDSFSLTYPFLTCRRYTVTFLTQGKICYIANIHATWFAQRGVFHPEVPYPEFYSAITFEIKANAIVLNKWKCPFLNRKLDNACESMHFLMALRIYAIANKSLYITLYIQNLIHTRPRFCFYSSLLSVYGTCDSNLPHVERTNIAS